MVLSYQQKIIQLGLNHSFKEISFVCVFVYLFFFSLAVGLPGALTEDLASLTTKKKLSSVHVNCHGVERDANWVGAQLIHLV